MSVGPLEPPAAAGSGPGSDPAPAVVDGAPSFLLLGGYSHGRGHEWQREAPDTVFVEGTSAVEAASDRRMPHDRGEFVATEQLLGVPARTPSLTSCRGSRSLDTPTASQINY